MPDRSEQILKIVCLVFGAVLIFLVGRLIIRADPLKHLTVPALPTLPAGADSAAKGTNASSSQAAEKQTS